MAQEKTTPTYGYAKDGTAKLFHLKEGEKLPAGYADSPAHYDTKDEKATKERGEDIDPDRVPPRIDENTAELPEKWEDLPWFALKKLCIGRTGETPKNKPDAIRLIKAEG
ncbi:hypothetical protein GCM10007276_12280 [Agaricicola taiwanensis]|uniref:Uncharacterized protein n=1 Tax=Agaricicola taiwanensis TaxID=591372 RepID=A0A8J2VLH4_9RHOB|nr:hypothetical protein [Agaricicola taiwanensis]GGE36355.1 hypothetical protein GCM10007276_12280 [Agaricicola taiwanensis]